MSRTESFQDVGVVLAALVGVFNQQANRRSGGLSLVHARQDFNRVGFIALGDVATGARTAAVQITLNIALTERQPWRTTVYHAANGRAVGFTKIGDCEKGSKGIAAHAPDYPRVRGEASSPIYAQCATPQAARPGGSDLLLDCFAIFSQRHAAGKFSLNMAHNRTAACNDFPGSPARPT